MSTISAGTTSNTALKQTGDTTGNLVLQTNGTTTALTIDTSQNVTLAKNLVMNGSTSGSVTLAAPAVAGTQSYTLPTGVPAANGYALTSTTGGVMSWAAAGGSPGGSNTQIQFNNSSAFGGSANLVWDGTYVGVGTSSPSTYSDSTPGITTYNSTAGGRSGIVMGSNATATDDLMGYVACFNSNSSNTNYRMASMRFLRGSDANSSYLTWFTANSGAPAERMRLDSAGKFSVGTPAGGFLSVQGSVNADFVSRIYNGDTSPKGMLLYYSAAAPNNAGTTNAFIQGQDNSAARWYFSGNGGLNNFSANNTNLSDVREKKNIALAGNYLDKINAIPVKTFLYNDQTDNDLNLGVIAQDVQAVAPELVTESDWGTAENPKMRLSVYQTDLQYALMKAIQELTARVAALEAK